MMCYLVYFYYERRAQSNINLYFKSYHLKKIDSLQTVKHAICLGKEKEKWIETADERR
jgi:hypothetical protein